MYFIKAFNHISVLCALLATAAATPAPVLAPAADDPSSETILKSRNELTDKVAVVDVYSGGTCGGSSQQVKQVNGGAQCYVLSGQSIDASFNGCSTSAWTDTKCQGSSVGVPNASCFSAVFASVLITCGTIKGGGS